MKLLLNPQKFVNLCVKGYSLDHIYLLKLLEQKIDLKDLRQECIKFDTLCHSLLRKGLITENEEITLMGKELLEFVDSKDKIKLIRKKNSEVDFDLWWKEFPGINKFIHKGKSFEGSRAMKTKKDDCKLKFYSILNEGEFTATQLIEALKLDVLMKKDDSYKTKENKLTFMQNSLTYLNQRSYEPFIELLGESKEDAIKPFDIDKYDGVNL